MRCIPVVESNSPYLTGLECVLMMKAVERDEVRRVFQVCCLASTPDEAENLLKQECRRNTVIYEAVQNLLEAERKHGDVFESSPDSLLGDGSEDRVGATRGAPSDVEMIGTSIRGYKLLQQIGEGGFGVVYMAQQTEPVRRKAALKVIKPGMDSKEVIARFEAERQALAMMDHPNVAKVLDGGTTESGRPYFVMELVHGTPITKFCDENRLPNRQRLELSIDVCRAVQHAHLKGIDGIGPASGRFSEIESLAEG